MLRTTLTILLALAALPSIAHAGSGVVPTDLAGCQIPLPDGATSKEVVDDTFENGNLTYESSEIQVNLVWFPGANAELNGESLQLYIDALGNSGAWFGDSTEWTAVGGQKAAIVPIKIGGEEQPQVGSLLIWADVASGRYFMYIATPLKDADLETTITAVAAGATCAGAGMVKMPIAVFDPLPPGWGVDDAGLPNMTYGRRDGKQATVLWSAPRPEAKYDCLEPAEPLLERYLLSRGLTTAGDLAVEVDDADGSQGGSYLCRVVVPVDGLSEAEGDVVSFSQWACAEDEGRIIVALDAAAGDLGDSQNMLLGEVKCLDDVPQSQVQLPDAGAEEEEEKAQWMPTRPPVEEDGGKKKKKKKKK